MLTVEEVRRTAEKRFRNQHKNWLDGQGSWPWSLSLEPPTESEAAQNMAAVRGWISGWDRAGVDPRPVVEERAWSLVGRQSIPTKLVFSAPAEVASFLGQSETWALTVDRASRLATLWPALHHRLGWAFDELAAWGDADFERLLRLVGWFLDHPEPGLFMRQIPVAGIHTKWIEAREPVVLGMGRTIDPRPERSKGGLVDWAGLLIPPPKVRIRVLCPRLACEVAGLTDLSAEARELAGLSWRPTTVLIVENHTTGTALPSIPGCVAVIGLGNAISVIGEWPWLDAARLFYWGDLDTWGLVILSRARRSLGQVQSLMMDEETLLGCQDFWGEETVQETTTNPDNLTEEERGVLEGLRQNRWGAQIRLEQERIPWETVTARLAVLL